ncbi:MAG: hypothetical protein V3V99_12660 [candidate division Zixibacteria bacterium]
MPRKQTTKIENGDQSDIGFDDIMRRLVNVPPKTTKPKPKKKKKKANKNRD